MKNVWFINFSGIGNGVMMVPILKCFEYTYPEVKYFHTENKILSDKYFIRTARLKNLKGLSEINWRRFDECYWSQIILFIQENHIDTIINLRNEGPNFDTKYYEFKNIISKKAKVQFYEIDFSDEENQLEVVSVEKKIVDLFKRLKVDFSNFNREWLKKGDFKKEGVVCVLAASQENKRLSEKNWISLLSLLKIKEQIFLVPGSSKREIDIAFNVQTNSKIKTSVVSHVTLSYLVGLLSEARVVISNDTGLLHVAAAVGTKAVGLYISTDSSVWAPQSSPVTIFQSNHYGKCEHLKKYAGNCLCYYGKCLTVKEYGDGIDMNKVADVVNSIEENIKKDSV